MINPMDLSGKLFLVTGASRGLGRQVCITISQLGARVALVARSQEGLEETRRQMEGEGHACYPFDLNNIEGIAELVKGIVAQHGKLDGLVHCAGLGITCPLSLITYDFMQKMMRINVFAFVELVRIFAKKKNCNKGGSIVAVSSAASIRGEKAKTAYSATKGALDSAVRALAAELGPAKKIRVNTVNPAWIKTDMFYDYLTLAGEEKLLELEQRQFLGIAEPVEIAMVISFLLSAAASQITGQSIVVAGGGTI